MIFFAGASIFMVPKGVQPSTIGWALAALLVAGGIGLLFLFQSKLVRKIAIGIALLIACSGVLVLLGHPEASLPSSPAMTIIVSLYLVFRIFMAEVYAKSADSPSVNDDDPAPPPPAA
jgi:CHASE2 domain-containing sensor protein